jgi:hypothetical protein
LLPFPPARASSGKSGRANAARIKQAVTLLHTRDLQRILSPTRCYSIGGPDAVSDAIDYAKFYDGSHDA